MGKRRKRVGQAIGAIALSVGVAGCGLSAAGIAALASAAATGVAGVIYEYEQVAPSPTPSATPMATASPAAK